MVVKMKRIIGFLAIIVTATLLLFTNQTNEFTFIIYLLILYLGNSLLISYNKKAELIPLLTCTQLFYIIDFYLLIKGENSAIIFAFLAVIFSFLTIILILKDINENVSQVEIKNERKKEILLKKISLVGLLIGLLFNVIILAFVSCSNVNCLYDITMLLMTLIMTIVIIYQGFISKNKKRYISNRPYFVLSVFYLLFLPEILEYSPLLFKILVVCFLAYILIILYYPLVKCEYYSLRRIHPKYKISFKEHLKKSFVYNSVLLLCALTLSFSLYYGYNDNVESSSKLSVYGHNDKVEFTKNDYDDIELKIRGEFDDAVFLGIKETQGEQTTSDGEKYKETTIYGYNDNSNDVYVYVYRKYTTNSKKHKISEIVEESSGLSEDLTVDDVKELNIDFS